MERSACDPFWSDKYHIKVSMSVCWMAPLAVTAVSEHWMTGQYVYQVGSAVNSGTATVGFPYALLEWCMVLILSLLVTWCIVVFWGINRGETTRLWIYLAVYFQIPAA